MRAPRLATDSVDCKLEVFAAETRAAAMAACFSVACQWQLWGDSPRWMNDR